MVLAEAGLADVFQVPMPAQGLNDRERCIPRSERWEGHRVGFVLLTPGEKFFTPREVTRRRQQKGDRSIRIVYVAGGQLA